MGIIREFYGRDMCKTAFQTMIYILYSPAAGTV